MARACVVVRLPITVELDQGIGTSSPIASGGVTQESGLKAKQCPRLVCLADANSPSRGGAAPADLRQRARSRPPSNAGSSAPPVKWAILKRGRGSRGQRIERY